MTSWLRYAGTELRHAFSVGGRGARNRDIAWMFAVLLLLISIIAVTSAMYRGLVVNFADSILGYTKGAGVPVRVAVDTDLMGATRLPSVASLFRNSAEIGGTPEPTPGSPVAGYDFHPFIETSLLKLPEGSWVAPPDERDLTVFSGWAVSAKSPLWTSLVADMPTSDTTIVVSGSSFDAAFNREGYVAGIREEAPDLLVEEWLAQNPEGQPLTSLLVKVRYNLSLEHYRSFQVKWLQSLPGVETISYLLPLELLQPLRLASSDQLYSFIPGRDLREPADLVSKLILGKLVDVAGKDEAGRQIDSLMACLGYRQKSTFKATLQNINAKIDFNIPAEKASIDHCLGKLNLDPKVKATALDFLPTKPILSLIDGMMQVTCRDIPDDAFRAFKSSGDRPYLATCLEGAEFVRISLLDQFGLGFAYVPDRRGLQDFVVAADNATVGGGEAKAGEQAREPQNALFISGVYRSSIDRFRYLLSTLEYIVLPMFLFFSVIAAYSLFASTSMFFSNRRIHYGVLLARGMGVFEIRLVIYAQFAVCFVMAAILAWLVLNATKMLLQSSFITSSAFGLALRELGIQSPAIVDSPAAADGGSSLLLSLQDVAFGAGVVLVLLVAILVWQMWRLPLRRRSYPMDLIANATN